MSSESNTDSTNSEHHESHVSDVPPNCYICLSPTNQGDEDDVMPCKCRNPVHKECLTAWINKSGATRNKCNICNTDYIYTASFAYGKCCKTICPCLVPYNITLILFKLLTLTVPVTIALGGDVLRIIGYEELCKNKTEFGDQYIAVIFTIALAVIAFGLVIEVGKQTDNERIIRVNKFKLALILSSLWSIFIGVLQVFGILIRSYGIGFTDKHCDSDMVIDSTTYYVGAVIAIMIFCLIWTGLWCWFDMWPNCKRDCRGMKDRFTNKELRTVCDVV